MTLKELTNKIEKTYKEKFKNSMVMTSHGTHGIYIDFKAAKTKDDFAFGISRNDPLNLGVYIEQVGDEFRLEFRANSILCKPKNKYLVYSSERIRATGAKKAISADALEKRMSRVFDNLENVLKMMFDEDMVHNNHVKLLEAML